MYFARIITIVDTYAYITYTDARPLPREELLPLFINN